MTHLVPRIDTGLAGLASRQSLKAQCEAYRECRDYSPHFARVALHEPLPAVRDHRARPAGEPQTQAAG